MWCTGAVVMLDSTSTIAKQIRHNKPSRIFRIFRNYNTAWKRLGRLLKHTVCHACSCRLPRFWNGLFVLDFRGSWRQVRFWSISNSSSLSYMYQLVSGSILGLCMDQGRKSPTSLPGVIDLTAPFFPSIPYSIYLTWHLMHNHFPEQISVISQYIPPRG